MAEKHMMAIIRECDAAHKKRSLSMAFIFIHFLKTIRPRNFSGGVLFYLLAWLIH